MYNFIGFLNVFKGDFMHFIVPIEEHYEPDISPGS